MRFPFFIGKEQPMAIYQGHNEDSSGNLLLSIGNGMTATVETGSTASQAYTKGSYLFFNNRLCKAASAIASGATLTIGSNLTQTSLGAELTSHLRSSDGKEFYFDVKNGQYGYYPSASKTASEFVPFGGTSFDFFVMPSLASGIMMIDLKNLQNVYHARYDSGSKTYTMNGVTFTCYYGSNGVWIKMNKNADLRITQNVSTPTDLLSVSYTANSQLNLSTTYPYAGILVKLT